MYLLEARAEPDKEEEAPNDEARDQRERNSREDQRAPVEVACKDALAQRAAGRSEGTQAMRTRRGTWTLARQHIESMEEIAGRGGRQREREVPDWSFPC